MLHNISHDLKMDTFTEVVKKYVVNHELGLERENIEMFLFIDRINK